MPDERADDALSEVISDTVARAEWGLLLIWIGAALLLHWSWGAGLAGAGALLLGAQAVRRYARVRLDRFGLVAGLLLVLCGAWSSFDVRVELLPLLCIGAGLALVVSIWTTKGMSHAPDGPADLHASPHPRT